MNAHTSAHVGAVSLQGLEELTPERIDALKDNLDKVGLDFGFLRIMALNMDAFATHVEEWRRKKWEAAYDAASLDERYAWVTKLLVTVIDLDLERQIPPALLSVREAAFVQTYGHGESDAPIAELEERAGKLQMLGALAETPHICPGLAGALRAAIFKVDRAARDAI